VTLQPEPRPGEEGNFRLLVESANDGIVILSDDNRILFANRAARRMSGYAEEMPAGLDLAQVLSPEEVGRVFRIRSDRHAGRPAPTRYESILNRSDGIHVPVEVTVAATRWEGSLADVVVLRDISERKRAEEELIRRESVLQAVSSAAAEVVQALNWQERIAEALEKLGRGIGAHRVYLWETQFDPAGEVRTTNRRLWVDDRHPRGPDPASLDGFPLRASGYGPWLEPLSRGEPLAVLARDFPEEVRDAYGALGVRSVLSVPIMVDGRLSRVLGLADCEREREWSTFEIDALMIMGSILGALIRRERFRDLLRRHDAILEAVTFAAAQFLESPAWEPWIVDLLERLGLATGASRVHIYKNRIDSEGEIHVTRRHAWIDPEAPSYPELASPREYPVRALGFGPFVDQAACGPWQVHVSAVPPHVQAVFQSLGVRSLLIVPIHVQEVWWGMLGLTDCLREREWSIQEVEALRAAANIVGAMIHRSRIETALIDSEAKYRSLVEGAQLSIVVIERSGTFRFANTTAARRLGTTQEEIVGRTMWDLFPAALADRQVAILREAIDAQKPLVVEMPTQVQGEERWHETRIQPLLDPSGGSDSALVIVNDVTERRRTQEKILSYQERLRSLSSELGLIELRERRRIAGLLHDRIGQALALAKIRMGALRRAVEGATAQSLDEIRSLIDQTIQDTRSLTFELSPPVLHELGFEPALEWLAERFQGQQGIPVTFLDEREEKPLAADVRVYLFQSVQELLMNVAKHARAHRVEIAVRRTGDEILVTVADDGVGFDSGAVTGGDPRNCGFGLFSIRERLFSLGGGIHIDSAPGSGTRIHLTAPIDHFSSPGGNPK
jgi:PAS domain S-box-containing protein